MGGLGGVDGLGTSATQFIVEQNNQANALDDGGNGNTQNIGIGQSYGSH